MNPNLFERLWPKLYDLLILSKQRLTPWRRHLFVIGTLCIVVPPILGYYRSAYTREIVILGGVPGSSGANLADRLREELEKSTNEYGLPYRVKVQTSGGMNEFQRQLEADHTGRLVGFQYDNYQQTNKLRTVFPMDHDYLHVLCNVKFLTAPPLDSLTPTCSTSPDASAVKDGQQSSKAENEPTVDRDLDRLLLKFADRIKKERFCNSHPSKIRRVYPGPKESVCRAFATQILKLYGLDIDEISHPGVNDWKDAQVALQKDELDFVIFLGQKNADTISSIAADRTAVLADLDKLAGALHDKTIYSTWENSFPPNSYFALPIPTPKDGLTLEFCPEKTKTLAARRLLTCNTAMRAHDAYAIMQAADRAFGGDGPAAGYWDSSPPSATIAPIRTGLGIKRHSVADLFVKEMTLPAWWSPRSWSPVSWGAAVTLALFLLERILSWLASHVQEPTSRPAATVAQPAHSPRYLLLEDEIALTEQMIERHGPMKTVEGWEFARRGLDELRERVTDSVTAGTLSPEEAAALHRRIDADIEKFPRPERKATKAEPPPAAQAPA